MDRRPIPGPVRQWFLDELTAWRDGGILSADQPDRILDLYETSTEAAARRRSLAMFALSGVAALMIGLAVLLLVGYNWQAMSAGLKVGVIFGTLLGSFLTAFWLRFRTPWRLSSEIVFFLSVIFYGASIWLVAQVFHIQSHYPDGIWFWALGVLPIALCLDTLLVHALYAFLLALWVGTEILGFHGLYPSLFDAWGFAWPRSAYTLPLLALPGLLWAYRKQSAATIGIYAPVLAWWGILQPVAWECEINPVYFVGLAGALLLLIAEMHRQGSRLALPYRLYGVLITGGVLVPLSHADFVMHLLRRSSADDNYVAGLAVGLIGAVAALGVVLLQRRDAADAGCGEAPFAAILRRQWLPLALVLLLAGLCFWTGLFSQYDPQHRWYSNYGSDAYAMAKWTPQVLVPVAAVNAMMIVLALWLMRVGLREDRTEPFAVGVLYFLLWAVLRYADLFAGVGGMLGAAVMFLLCGLGLFAVSRFWLHRRDSLPSPAGRGAGGEGGKTDNSQTTTAPPEALTLTLSRRERAHEPSPPWLDRTVGWLKRWQRTALWSALGLQVLVLAGMIAFKAGPLWTGETVLLRVVPVDPRDMFRGDYVTLSYDFTQIPAGRIQGLPPAAHDRRREWSGKTVYVSLLPEEDGKHWRAGRIGTEPPAEGKYIRGTIAGYGRIQCGIESYYVQEGQGREYEDAARNRRLSAEVALAADGRATLRRLHIGEPQPTAGPAYDPQDKYRCPSNRTYYVRRLPSAKIQLDGRLDEPEWSRANVERHFTFPWKESDAPPTEFLAFCDDQHLYFAFRAEDADIVALDQLRDKEDGIFEDRVELFVSRDSQMKDYFCLEIDSRGRTLDYRGSYYRQFDRTWSCDGLETAAAAFEKGYVVEGRIPRAALAEMQLPPLEPGARLLCGLYRAEFSHDRSGKPVEHKETIHNRGRRPPLRGGARDGPPPLEEWISWIDPQTPEPDFHVPSSLGWLEVVE